MATISLLEHRAEHRAEQSDSGKSSTTKGGGWDAIKISKDMD